MESSGSSTRAQTLRGDRGFTLMELMLAMMIVAIGLIGVTGALGLQNGGVVAGQATGHAAVTRGYYWSTATMLAQQRLEEVKQLQYVIGPPAVDQYGADPIPAGFADEAAGSIAGYPVFSRTVRVQTGVPAANLKLVTVTVSFPLPTQTGTTQESVALSTLIAAQP